MTSIGFSSPYRQGNSQSRSGVCYEDKLAGPVTARALVLLENLFAAGSVASGSHMAGRAEEGLGDPDVVAASCAALASDVIAAVAAPYGSKG